MKNLFYNAFQHIVLFGKHRIYVLLVSLICSQYVYAEHPDDNAPANVNNAKAFKTLTFSEAFNKVLENDLALVRSDIEVKGFASQARSMSALPDPTIFASMQNLPTNTFNLDQEAMTQLRVGVRQMFPKGKSLSLNESIAVANVAIERAKQNQRRLRLR